MIRFLVLVGLGAAAASGLEAQPLRVITIGDPAAGYLGIGSVDINAERAKELKLSEEIGVEVTRLERDSPAAAAGLRLEDVLVQYNGQRVEGEVQLERLIRETPPGRDVRIQVIRNGYAQTLIARIGVKPAMRASQIGFLPLGASAAGVIPDIPTPRMSWRNGLGAEWETLDGQLAAFFGVKDGGVLVRSVTTGSAAERAGLKAGDVIIRVGEAKVATPADVSVRIRAVREASAAVTIVRDKREMTVSIPLEGTQN